MQAGTGHRIFLPIPASPACGRDGRRLYPACKTIDGVYDSDPAKNPDAKRYDTISIQEVIDRKLAVVDLTASIMCLEHKMPMAVFDLNEKDSIANAMQGKINGTIVTVD